MSLVLPNHIEEKRLVNTMLNYPRYLVQIRLSSQQTKYIGLCTRTNYLETLVNLEKAYEFTSEKTASTFAQFWRKWAKKASISASVRYIETSESKNITKESLKTVRRSLTG